MSKEGKMELHEKTAKAEAAVCTDEEKRWCDIALSALPDDQAKRYNVIPQDVREFFAAFSARLRISCAAARVCRLAARVAM